MSSKFRSRLEVPIFGPDDGALAVSLGASRLELNRAGSYPLGGTTPTLTELSALLTSLTTTNAPDTRPPIRVMIRPRGPPSPGEHYHPQDFIYTPAELTTMKSAVTEFISSGLLDGEKGDGFVFGILAHDSVIGKLELDIERNKELVELARGSGLGCVLHRAVDDLFSSLSPGEDVGGVLDGVAECGFEGVLTSGGEGDAVGNLGVLTGVVAGLRKKGFEVVVGGGVRSEGLGWLVAGLTEGEREEDELDGVWFHSSCFGAGGRFDGEEATGLMDVMGVLGLAREQ